METNSFMKMIKIIKECEGKEKTELKKALIEAEKEIKERVPTINKGGCGFLAYFLAQELLEMNIFSFNFIVVQPLYSKIGFISCKHMWIDIVQSDGITPTVIEFNKAKGGKLTDLHIVDFYFMMDSLKKSLERKTFYGWNKEYKKSNNKLVKEILKKWLNNIKA